MRFGTAPPASLSVALANLIPYMKCSSRPSHFALCHMDETRSLSGRSSLSYWLGE